MSNIKLHAMSEFRAAGWIDDEGKYTDEMQQMLCEGVIRLLDVFAEEGHSGSSAPYAINLFQKLAAFEPIVPVTGEDWEWVDVGDDLFQNKRCSHLFRDKNRFNGQAYDIDGRIFWNWHKCEDGTMMKSSYSSKESCVPIEFPYTSNREYVFAPTEEFPNEVL